MLLRLKKIIKTAIMGGLVVLLPSFLLVNIAIWLYQLIQSSTLPLVLGLNHYLQQPLWLVQFIIVALILSICLLMGLLIQNRLGAFFVERIESLILNRFPGYKSLKELVGYFLSNDKKSVFSHPVLVQPWGNDSWMTGFLVDSQNNTATVFIPTGPNPSTGLIVHVATNKLRTIDATSTEVFKTIIGCGVGSSAFYIKENHS